MMKEQLSLESIYAIWVQKFIFPHYTSQVLCVFLKKDKNWKNNQIKIIHQEIHKTSQALINQYF